MVAENRRETFVFRIDPKLLQYRPPRLTLAATLDALGQRVQTHDLDANVVVDILDEKRLLPYIIGSIKNLHIVSLGQITNASKVGDIIVSEESIRGTYELSLAFLRFVLTVLKSDSYIDRSNAMLASITYIANEIYSNHHIWTYRNVSDMHEILSLCTEIFYHCIVVKSASSESREKKIRKSSEKEQPSALEIVCVINLSQNQAHKQLLSVIVDGKQAIKGVISEPNFEGEHTLRESPIVIRTRQSLSIFRRLLSQSENIKNYYESQNLITEQNLDGSATNYSSVPMTNIERALFDTSLKPGLLQRLFSYIYQEEDCATACLVVDLIKRVAEKFSMSLMASLDSDADKACEFFIDCLKKKETNIDLKIAILDLLTTCVRHQPGLIESFLNYNRDATSKDNGDKKGNMETLQVVLTMIKDCLNQQNDIKRSLHGYVMQFILAFWQKCHSAIEQFDKVDDFWDTITKPLVKFLDSTNSITCQEAYTSSQASDDKLVSYVLMILAREIFNVNVSESGRKLNPKLKEKLDELASKNLMGKYSTFVVRRYSNIPSNLNKCDDYSRVLAGWRDFLASYSKYNPFDINQAVKIQLIENALTCLSVELKLAENLDKERLMFTGEALLLIWIQWKAEIPAGDKIFETIHELLYLGSACKEYVPFAFLLTFLSILNMYLMRYKDYLLNAMRSFDLLVPALDLVHFSVKILDRFIANEKKPSLDNSNIGFEYKPGIESRLCHSSVTALQFIIDIARPNIDLWINYVQTNLKADVLVQFVALLLDTKADPEVCLAIVELLSCVSLLSQKAYYFNKSRLLPLLEQFLANESQQSGWSANGIKMMSMVKTLISSASSKSQYPCSYRQRN